jgi:predicted CoA-binding protein
VKKMMVTQAAIQQFLAQKKIAVIGVSRSTKEFANSAYRMLKSRGYSVFPVNPFTERVEGDRCYTSVKALPEKVDGALVMLPPEKTESVVPEIVAAGIRNIWIQQKSESERAVQYCVDHNINVVHNECIIMFAEPVGFPHRLHRWIKKLTGKLPN